MHSLMTPANLLSMLRLVLTIPIVYLILSGGGVLWILLLVAVASLTDFFDGYLARKRGEQTQLGLLLDPLADKGMVIGIMLALVYVGAIPLSWLFVLAGKELLLVVGGALLLRDGGQVPASRTLGKWSTGVIFVGLLLLIAVPYAIGRLVLAGGILVSLLAGVDYAILVWRMRRPAQ